MFRMTSVLWWFLCMSLFVLFVSACAGHKTKVLADDLDDFSFEKRPFDKDSALLFLKTQTDFGPRIPHSAAQKACANYLQKNLERFADTVYRQSFTAKSFQGENYRGDNLIASFLPENPRRILLAAHWDSRPWADHDPNDKNHKTPILGANDGASGVAVLLEIARQLQAKAPEVGVDIVFFDLEDAGTPEWAEKPVEHSWCLGAQHWATHPHVLNYRAQYGILLDMVGNSKPLFIKEGSSMYFAPDVMDAVWKIAAQMGYGDIFLNRVEGAILDDHVYVNQIAGIPMIDIIHRQDGNFTGFFPQWHTLEDTPEYIDPNTLEIVGKVVLGVLAKEEE